MIEALEGSALARLRLSAEWAERENRPLLATACRDAEARMIDLEKALRLLLDQVSHKQASPNLSACIEHATRVLKQ
jgi:hypothetical protein